MKLHLNDSVFNELISATAQKFNLPVNAVRKDYYITLILQNLENCAYYEDVVFKGGTSLSKCYPGTIERFSEDIDLTYIPERNMSDKQIGRKLKIIEKALIGCGRHSKIREERNNRNKSSYVWFNDAFKDIETVKLEIGSSVRPEPYGKRPVKSYIHEFLIISKEEGVVEEYQLQKVELNVLNIERTFIDKLMAVKRHAYCGTLPNKVRHIYDVVKLHDMREIQKFLKNEDELTHIMQLTKKTDAKYLKKRNIPKEYMPLGPYAYEIWKDRFNKVIKSNYESLHDNLLYTDEKQDFEKAVEVFEDINRVLMQIGE